jgi:hypothetical protein
MRTADQRMRVAGLRDYSRWAFDLFPGRVGPTDLDFAVQNEAHNRFLVLELKQGDEPLGLGQERLLRGLTRLPEFAVAVVREYPEGVVVGNVESDGVVSWVRHSPEEWRAIVSGWWASGVLARST